MKHNPYSRSLQVKDM